MTLLISPLSSRTLSLVYCSLSKPDPALGSISCIPVAGTNPIDAVGAEESFRII